MFLYHTNKQLVSAIEIHDDIKCIVKFGTKTRNIIFIANLLLL